MMKKNSIKISFRKIQEDEEYGLWSVTIFKKVFEEFKYNCSKNK